MFLDYFVNVIVFILVTAQVSSLSLCLIDIVKQQSSFYNSQTYRRLGTTEILLRELIMSIVVAALIFLLVQLK